MESINEESISTNNAPPFCSCLGVVALPLYHIGKVQCKIRYTVNGQGDPCMSTGKNIAYVRVSTVEQNEARQRESLKNYNIDK